MTTALITGGNRGLGQAVAVQLAERGLDVIIGARDVAAGEAVAEQIGTQVRAVQLDVTDRASLRAAATWIRERGGLDILINNAGVLPEATASSAEAVDLDLFRATYDVNVFGPVAVLAEFLPLLRKSEHGRVVNVSTTMGSLTDQTNPDSPYYAMVLPAYQSSKAALNAVTIAVAKALADTPITVTSVCPGFVQTDLTPINRQQAPLTPAEAAEVVVRAALLDDDAASGTFIDSRGTVPW